MRPNWKRLLGGILGLTLLLFFLPIVDRNGVLYGFLNYLGKHPSQAFVFIIVYLGAFALLGYWLARNKGRDPWAWMLGCFVTHIYGIIILWALPDARKMDVRDRANNPETTT